MVSIHHSWMFLGMTKLWHRPWRWSSPSSVHKQNLVKMTQEAHGFTESCWGCCGNQCSGKDQPTEQQRRDSANGTRDIWPNLRLSAAQCVLCECFEMSCSLFWAHILLNSLNSQQSRTWSTTPLFEPKVLFGSSGNLYVKGSKHFPWTAGPPWCYCLCLSGFLWLQIKIG